MLVFCLPPMCLINLLCRRPCLRNTASCTSRLVHSARVLACQPHLAHWPAPAAADGALAAPGAAPAAARVRATPVGRLDAGMSTAEQLTSEPHRWCSQERSHKAARTSETRRWAEPSLLLALGRTYGLQYAALGVLRLADIALGFAGIRKGSIQCWLHKLTMSRCVAAGPLLLNALVSRLTSEPEAPEDSQDRTARHLTPLQWDLLLAGLLGAASLVKVRGQGLILLRPPVTPHLACRVCSARSTACGRAAWPARRAQGSQRSSFARRSWWPVATEGATTQALCRRSCLWMLTGACSC